MRTCKIIDTCTLINLFCESETDVSKELQEYDAIVTDDIVREYTRKYPREIPSCVKVVSVNDDDRLLMNRLESLMPSIGTGERSAYAVMIRLSKQYDRIVLLTDDKKATKKLRSYLMNDGLFEAPAKIIWANSDDFLKKITSESEVKNRSRRSPVLSDVP